MDAQGLTVITRMHGDYWRVEEAGGLLDVPHPFDPNRMAALPMGGYGWPTEDAALTLKYKLYGFRPTTLEQQRSEREAQKLLEKVECKRKAALQKRMAHERELLTERKLLRLRRRALKAMGVAS